MLFNTNRTIEEIFKDGQMHEWLISNGYKLINDTYYAPASANPNDMFAAHLRIYGEEIQTKVIAG